MAYLSRITKASAVEEAIAECELLGQEAFLATYEFGTPREYFIKFGGKRYPSKAIMGVAYGIQHPTEGPLKSSTFIGGKNAAARRLLALGFDVVKVTGDKEVSVRDLLTLDMEALVDSTAADLNEKEYFDPKSMYDARDRIVIEIAQRRGQRKFRNKLLAAYGRRCAISDCDCADALEAAHILPYKGDHTNHVQNGLLLRADLHTLFDLGKISIDAANNTVVVAAELKNTVYDAFHGKTLKWPSISVHRPNPEALTEHRKSAGL